MTTWLARALYATALRLGLPLYFLRLWWRGRREPGYRTAWAERMGLGPRTEPGAIWVHAVSLGETRAAAALLAALRGIDPGMRLLLTHGTATGRAAGHDLLKPGDHQCWLPFDTPGAVARFVDRHRPAVGVLMETELWPNLLHEARECGLTMVLANARLSARSERKGHRAAWLMHPAAACVNLALAQTADDAARLRRSGVLRVEVSGNLKFDVTPPPRLVARGLQWRQSLPREVVLAAITREGEEEMLLRCWAGVPQPRPLLLLVPRHPQRFEEVAALVADLGFTMERRSHWQDQPPPDAAQADVWLGDSLGEMPTYYGCADAALLGGSFRPLGGHNLIEAAACGCPLVMGPHTFNFQEAAELALAAGAAQRAGDIEDGVARAVALARDPQRNAWVQRAFDFAASHRGAALRMAERVMEAAGHRRRPG